MTAGGAGCSSTWVAAAAAAAAGTASSAGNKSAESAAGATAPPTATGYTMPVAGLTGIGTDAAMSAVGADAAGAADILTAPFVPGMPACVAWGPGTREGDDCQRRACRPFTRRRQPPNEQLDHGLPRAHARMIQDSACFMLPDKAVCSRLLNVQRRASMYVPETSSIEPVYAGAGRGVPDGADCGCCFQMIPPGSVGVLNECWCIISGQEKLPCREVHAEKITPRQSRRCSLRPCPCRHTLEHIA